eukprot:314380-Pyramimonas_sp.AAC.1
MATPPVPRSGMEEKTDASMWARCTACWSSACDPWTSCRASTEVARSASAMHCILRRRCSMLLHKRARAFHV